MDDDKLARELFAGEDLVVLEPDEAEALKLADLENLYQEKAAQLMGISRQTFGRILDRAHRKVADALLNGKALKIERAKAPCLERSPFTENSFFENRGLPPFTTISPKNEGITMKIAFISDDGRTISRHFGRAAYYVVLTIENGKVVQKETRSKLGHTQFSEHHEVHHEHGASGAAHGYEPGAMERHASMAQAILDCKALIVGGMGAGAYDGIKQAGIEPIVTDIESIDEAARAYIAGTLENHVEYLH